MVPAGTADTGCEAWRTAAHNGYPCGNECDLVSAADRLPVALSAVYSILRGFRRDGVWEAIWAELHAALRIAMGREASPSAGVLDSQSVKSAENILFNSPGARRQ